MDLNLYNCKHDSSELADNCQGLKSSKNYCEIDVKEQLMYLLHNPVRADCSIVRHYSVDDEAGSHRTLLTIMWTPILLFSVLSYGWAHPIDDSTISYKPSEVVSLERDLNLVSYIQNFKQVMADYVNSQYTDLTVNEMEKVKLTLEDFLRKFATDLRETIEGKNNEEVIETNDDTFSEIKRNIIKEFPDVTPEVADRIVFKLKNNLYATRNRLDEIIRESARAKVENSE